MWFKSRALLTGYGRRWIVVRECSFLLLTILLWALLLPGKGSESTRIIDVRWCADNQVIEILLNSWPGVWPGWKMYLDGVEIPMEGGPGKPVIRPNAGLSDPPTGLLVGTLPWVTGLGNVDFPCSGTIQFAIPGQGLTNIYQYNLRDFGCRTAKEVAPTTLAPVKKPTPTPTPPRPKTPFVTKEKGTLFQDNFEDGMADGWALDPGWDVLLESRSGNYVLAGRGHGFARPNVSGWSDYTIEVRFKLVKGDFHLNLRENIYAGHIRYFLGVHSGGLHLSKQITSDFFDLSQSRISLKLNRWYTIKAVLEGNNIKVFLDGALVINYTDNSIPIRSGISSFETFEDSVVHFDNILVTGTRVVQRARWVKTGGPSGGLGYDVRIHPQDKRIMFVTDNPSGVNKSYDGGATWVARNKGITARGGPSGDGIPVFSLTIDPNNPNIVWAGTQGMRGIFKSTDGGETWVKKDKGIAEFWEITFRGFAVRPGNSNIVFAAAEIDTGIHGVEFSKTRGKIYKTTDGGENWRCVWEGDNLVRIIIFDPSNPDTLYASTGIFNREAYNKLGVGVLKSTDGGETWRQINNGITNLFIGFLVMHPTNPQILFAAAGHNTMELAAGGGVYRTTNGGESWIQVLKGEAHGIRDGQCFQVVTISPSNPDVVYAGTASAFYRSDDGGNTWQKFYRRKEGGWGPPGVRTGCVISAVVDPDDPMTIFANAYGGGVFKSTDGARTWVNSSKGYTGADLSDIAIDLNNPDIVYTGGAGRFRSFNAGEDWEGIFFDTHDTHAHYMFAVALNPDNPQIVIVSDREEGKIIKSVDGGNSWQKVFDHPEALADPVGDKPANRHGFKTIVFAPSNPDIVYAGMRALNEHRAGRSFGIYKSVDGGKTWREKNRGLEKSTKMINCIAVHPRNPDIAYVGTLHDGVYKTTNGGKSWVPVNNGLMSLDVRSLAIDPKNPEIVYAGLGEGAGIFKTTNGGKFWEGVNYGISVECPSYLQKIGQVRPGVSLVKPKRLAGIDYYSIPWTTIRSIVIDPVEPNTLYAADFSLGVYMSTDGGHSWTPINEGLSTKAVSALALSADGRVLYAATSGEGVFRLELW